MPVVTWVVVHGVVVVYGERSRPVLLLRHQKSVDTVLVRADADVNASVVQDAVHHDVRLQPANVTLVGRPLAVLTALSHRNSHHESVTMHLVSFPQNPIAPLRKDTRSLISCLFAHTKKRKLIEKL